MSRTFINNAWLFSENFKEEYLLGEIDSSFSKVRLPHTVKELPYNYFSENDYQMISTYRKVIKAPKTWSGKNVLITFEGAAHYAEVFLNGEKIGETTQKLYDILTGIQWGKTEDEFGWIVPVC